MSWVRWWLRMMTTEIMESWKSGHINNSGEWGIKAALEKISVTRWRNSSCQLLYIGITKHVVRRTTLVQHGESNYRYAASAL